MSQRVQGAFRCGSPLAACRTSRFFLAPVESTTSSRSGRASRRDCPRAGGEHRKHTSPSRRSRSYKPIRWPLRMSQARVPSRSGLRTVLDIKAKGHPYELVSLVLHQIRLRPVERAHLASHDQPTLPRCSMKPIAPSARRKRNRRPRMRRTRFESCGFCDSAGGLSRRP